MAFLGILSFGRTRILTASMLVLAAWALLAHAQPGDEPNLVHFGDVIDVDIEGSFEFDWRGKVNPEGLIDAYDQFGDPVPGLCRSEADIALDIARLLGKTLREPKVTVRIVDRSGRAFATLDGAVKTPHRFRLNRRAKLQELIIFTGGITDEASGEISIFRPPSLSCVANAAVQGQAPIVTVRVADLLAGKADANPDVFSGDLVTVLKALPIYVMGGVRNPRPIASREKMTVTRVIAIAGGLSKDSDGEITIFRRRGSDQPPRAANLKRIEAGVDPDIELSPFDIVDVSQKGRARRTTPPVIVGRDASRDASMPLRIVD